MSHTISAASKNVGHDPNTYMIQKVSDTAFWVASYRATESKKSNPLFVDPLAEVLVGEAGKFIASSMQPIEKYAYWSVIIRTRLIDDYISTYVSQGYTTIINLGAGLDTRPYRLSLPQNTHWIEIDFPEVMEFKNIKLKDQQPNFPLERIGLDLSNQTEREQIFNALNERTMGPAIILTEGVIPYLSEESVCSLATAIHKQSNFKLWISEYYAPEMYPRFQNKKFKAMLGESPFKFFPSNWFSFFEGCGWNQKEIAYLYDIAKQNRRKFPLPWWAAIMKLFLGEKMMSGVSKLSAYVVFEKKPSNPVRQ